MMASGGFLSSARTSVADLVELEVRDGPAIQTPFSAATSGCIGISANTITRTQHRSGEAVADVSAQERRCNDSAKSGIEADQFRRLIELALGVTPCVLHCSSRCSTRCYHLDTSASPRRSPPSGLAVGSLRHDVGRRRVFPRAKRQHRCEVERDVLRGGALQRVLTAEGGRADCSSINGRRVLQYIAQSAGVCAAGRRRMHAGQASTRPSA